MPQFSGLGMHLGNLSRLSNAETRSINPSNPTGKPGQGNRVTTGTGAHAARKLGRGWKISPSIIIEPGECRVLGDAAGPGAIQQMWMTVGAGVLWRNQILRIYWDGQEHPSVECPLGDFFCVGWEKFAEVKSLGVCVNPASGFNCFWEMPFRKRAKITLENRGGRETVLYYQINLTLTEIEEDRAYFHAQFRRSNPVCFKKEHVILDGIQGWGHYVGTYMAIGVNGGGWWGEGPVSCFIDEDKKYPSVIYEGTEDYFLGSYNFDVGTREPKRDEGYVEHSNLYSGMPQVLQPDGLYESQTRFGLYRWHIMDPIRFKQRYRMTIKDLGWHPTEGRYMPRRDDITTVAFWYQKLPTARFPELQNPDYLVVL